MPNTAPQPQVIANKHNVYIMFVDFFSFFFLFSKLSASILKSSLRINELGCRFRLSVKHRRAVSVMNNRGRAAFGAAIEAPFAGLLGIIYKTLTQFNQSKQRPVQSPLREMGTRGTRGPAVL